MIRKRLGACVAVTGALFIVGSGLQACGGDDDSSGGGGKGGSGATDGSTGGTAGATGLCGNGTTETETEECDDGNLTSGDGCDNNCEFTCSEGDSKCDDANPCTGTESCGSDHKCVAGTPLNEGDSCGTDLVCVGGNCVSAACGDGQQQTGEECDDGDVDETNGCNTQCTYTCVSTDPSKDCTATGDECAGSNVCDDAAHTCTGGTPLGEGANCNNNLGTCKSSICTLKTCGNGTVDTGEQCEPPGTATCNAQCQDIVTAACGNGTIEAPEQCDDSNTENLDGCDSQCKYEAVVRLISASIADVASPPGCTPTTNRLGTQSIVKGIPLDTINNSLTDGINAGTTNVIVQALGLDDLTGTADSSFEIGIMSGSLDPAKGTWPGASNPIDWWFLVQPSGVDANGIPTGKLAASLSAKNITAGPADVTLSLLLSGSPALLEMRGSRIAATTTGTPSMPAPPPTALAPELAMFPELKADGSNQGLCGNITVASLAKIPIPEALTTGATACKSCTGSKVYTYCGEDQPVGPTCNSLLDALVGGCKATLLFPACNIPVINANPPDVAETGSAVKPLTPGNGNKIPAAQTDNNKDAYSAYLKFNARRAHITGKQTP